MWEQEQERESEGKEEREEEKEQEGEGGGEGGGVRARAPKSKSECVCVCLRGRKQRQRERVCACGTDLWGLSKAPKKAKLLIVIMHYEVIHTLPFLLGVSFNRFGMFALQFLNLKQQFLFLIL